MRSTAISYLQVLYNCDNDIVSIHVYINVVCIFPDYCIELSPHTIGEAFYNGEMENELRRIDKIDYRLYKDSDRDKCMEMIEDIRRQSIYPHNDDACTAECKKRGTLNYSTVFYRVVRDTLSGLSLHACLCRIVHSIIRKAEAILLI